MALKATIFKVKLQVADMIRQHYADYVLTLARHPSETDARMMVRLLAFALHADKRLRFSRGLSTESEPGLWLKEPDGGIALWIELGQPDEKRLRKACARAKQVVVYNYQRRGAEIWWAQGKPRLRRFENLRVRHLREPCAEELAALVQRTMRLQCTIDHDQCWLSDEQRAVAIELHDWWPPG